ncbi:hypothetical protein QU487_01720 [Crenobacter sp. SG2305]|uniref:hypothetical protein n=1 Tax=Crenobacter oryzisoli TaxID=3056844 RepID=UPI0025AA597C|nr:hypothetical protein [Crenobacter sp. SG2305]MDN0081476.1 hypothetical protein [Crenobacter sp. SG2305]
MPVTLPPLDTVSFDAELPLQSRPLDALPARLDRETRLALRLLAAPTETRENSDPLLLRVEAKLDLALELGLLARHQGHPSQRASRVGLEALAWHAPTSITVGERLLLTLFPNVDSALALLLPVVVEYSQGDGEGGSVVKARLIAPFDDGSRESWERWVFRRHRLGLHSR